jgi:hypothetical protein
MEKGVEYLHHLSGRLLPRRCVAAPLDQLLDVHRRPPRLLPEGVFNSMRSLRE